MKEEKEGEESRCWICHRTEKQVIEERGDIDESYSEIAYDKKDSVSEHNLLGYVEV